MLMSIIPYQAIWLEEWEGWHRPQHDLSLKNLLKQNFCYVWKIEFCLNRGLGQQMVLVNLQHLTFSCLFFCAGHTVDMYHIFQCPPQHELLMKNVFLFFLYCCWELKMVAKAPQCVKFLEIMNNWYTKLMGLV